MKTTYYPPGDCFDFVVHTDRDRFLDWLATFVGNPHYVQQISAMRDRIDAALLKERTALGESPGRDPDKEATLLGLDLAVGQKQHTSNSVDVAVQLVHDGWRGDALSFRLSETASDRTHVKACWDPAHQGLGQYFVSELVKAYPEVEAGFKQEEARDLNEEWLDFVARWAEAKGAQAKPRFLPMRVVVPLPIEDIDEACNLHLLKPHREQRGRSAKGLDVRRQELRPGKEVVYEVTVDPTNWLASALKFLFARRTLLGHFHLSRQHQGLTVIDISSAEQAEIEFVELVSDFFSRWRATMPEFPENRLDTVSKADDDSSSVQEVKLPKDAALQRKPSGRRPDPEYDAAFQVFLELGQDNEALQAAFDHWCTLTDREHPDKYDRDTFRKAMRRREVKHNKSIGSG